MICRVILATCIFYHSYFGSILSWKYDSWIYGGIVTKNASNYRTVLFLQYPVRCGSVRRPLCINPLHGTGLCTLSPVLYANCAVRYGVRYREPSLIFSIIE